MFTKNCVKISYKGHTQQIVCDEKFQYDNLLNAVIEKFNIDNSLKLAIEFYDEQGNKFNKDTFEYLMMLFPHPQKLFFIRLDSAKIPCNPKDTLAMMLEEENSTMANKKHGATTMELETHYEAVPVRRQNCFLGELPGVTTSEMSLPDSNTTEILERMRCVKESLPRKQNFNNSKHIKRSLRI